MTWFKVVNCVNTELFPVLAVALKNCINEKLSEENHFKPYDFHQDVIDDIIDRLKRKRTMNNKEINYLHGLFRRAIEITQKRLVYNLHCNSTVNIYNIHLFNGITGPEAHQHDAIDVTKKCKDICSKWPGLSVDILFDIFGVHKALLFGRLQRAEYSPTQFFNDLKIAEEKVLGDNICTQHVSKEDKRLKMSFYPEYVINDDLFEIMACHYAVSSVVRSMREEVANVGQMQLLSVVVPVATCSRYDVDISFRPTISNIDDYVRDLATSGICLSQRINTNIANVIEIAKTIQDLLALLKMRVVHYEMAVILFHRKEATKHNRNTVLVFGCDDVSKVKELRNNYFISFHFDVSDTLTRCWMNFGIGQRLRFYPEYAVWIIPHLFVRSTSMTAHKFLERIYGENYKHGWRVSLDDPTFNKNYHIITQHEHISNNYNREEVDAKKKGVQRLLRDHLDDKLRWKTAVTFNKHVVEQAYDSEAILEDMEDTNDSNIASFSGIDGSGIRSLKFAVLKFQNMECAAKSIRELADCEHVDILIENLRNFQDCGLVVDALNVVQFDVDSVITAFDHLVKVHGFFNDQVTRTKIQSFIEQRVFCHAGAACGVLKMHSERKREREKVEEKRDEPVHEVDTLCEVTADTLNSIHCYLLHHQEHLYRLQAGRENEFVTRFSTAVDEEEANSENEMKEDGAKEALHSQGINFGLNILQWIPFGQEPLFDTLGAEMVRNPDSTIDDHIFQQFLLICLAKIKETNYTINEMVCLKLYTDTNAMQSQLRKAHWTAALLKVRKAYYQWAIGLYRAHLYHDKPIPTAGSTSKPCRLYHGLNQLLTVSKEMPIYFGPFSSTIAKTVASTFCNSQGLIWLIQSSYVNPLKVVVGINVDWISGFKHEREVLLYNQCLPIQETETFDDDSNILMNHFIQSLISRESPIIKKDVFYKQLGVRLDAKWMRSICDHKLVFDKTKCGGMRVIDRIVLELGVMETDMIIKLWNTKHDDKTELEYFVEDLNATQFQDHYHLLTTTFKMLHFSPLLNRTWLQFNGNPGDDKFKSSKYKTNGQSLNTTTCSVKGQVTRIQVKNLKFFGNRILNLQTIQSEQGHKKTGEGFVECLHADRYGYLFVNDIPTRNHQFVIGDEVKCENDEHGKIYQLAAGQICVQIGDEKRWIKKESVPMKITLCFPYQADIGKYEFMLDVSGGADPQKQSDSQHWIFSDINSFAIPYPSSLKEQSDTITLGIYAKRKGTDLPLIKIKSIEYPPNDENENVSMDASILKTDVESKVNQLMRTLKQRDSEIRGGEVFLNSSGLHIDEQSEWMDYIDEHPSLFDVTSYRRKLVIERLMVELNLMSTEWVHRILDQTKEDKPMLEWLVKDRRVAMLQDQYRVMTSRFEISHFSPLLNRSWLRFTGKDSESYFKDIEYKINGQRVSNTTSSVKGAVTRIEVKNLKLFGNHTELLQTFDEKDDYKGISDAFVDSMTVDQYDSDVLFVVNIPKKDHQFAIGDDVQCDDGLRGSICEVTASRICVEIKDEIRWIERSVVPMTITLIFPHQQDIAKYEFVISDAVDSDPPDLSVAKHHFFSDIARFEIPVPSSTFDIYAKPKGKRLPLIKIKTIKYPPNDVADSVSLMLSLSKTDTESIVNQLMITLKGMDSEIRDNISFLNSFDLKSDDHPEWMNDIAKHPLLLDVSSYRRKLVIERLIVELKLMNIEWVHKILEQKRETKPMLEWLVEDRKVNKLLGHYQVMTSKFKIVHFSSLLNRSWLQLETNNKMKDRGVSIDEDYNMETEYKVNGEIFNATTFSVKGKVTKVQVKNTKFFGLQFMDFQQFHEEKEEKEVSTASITFIDSLTVDQYGFVFVDNIPKSDHPFTEGDMVRNKDDKICKICEMTADRICVETGDEKEWIEKIDVSTTLAWTFPHQEEIGKYEFVPVARSGNNVSNVSDAQTFSFSDVKQCEMPCPSIKIHPSDEISVAIYAKPKGLDVPLAKIKSIEFAPQEMSDPVISNMQSIMDNFIRTLKQTRTEIRDEVSFLNLFGLQLHDQSKWMHLIMDHPMLFDDTLYRKKLVIERLVVEFKLLLNSKWVQRMLKQRKEGKSLLEWLVEDRKLYRLFPHYRVLKSGFKVHHEAHLLNRFWMKSERCTKMDDEFRVKSSDDSIICSTQYKFNDVICPLDSTPSAIGLHQQPYQIVKNNALFGDIGMSVECGYFNMDTAIIAPVSRLVDGMSAKDVLSWFTTATKDKRERAIKLEVSSYRGQYKKSPSDVPKCLLQEGTDQRYQSLVNDQQNPTEKDWIIFKTKVKRRVVPTKIVVRNYHDKWAIKTILVSGSNDNVHFEDWCKIENIQQRKDKLQIFTVDAVSAHFAFMKQFKYFRINITENYSGGTNLFYEFAMYGMRSVEDVPSIELRLDSEPNDLISALEFDRYGCVFVDDTPSEAYPFTSGQEVQYDDMLGNICRMTTDKICVKSEIDGMYEFRWIQREAAPQAITLVFEHQEDLDVYEFAATVNQRDISEDLLATKKHSFSRMNQFSLPVRQMLIDHSDVFPIDIYAKPKDSKSQWTRIKTIDYSSCSSDNDQYLKCSDVDELFMTLKQRKSEIKNNAFRTSESGIHSLPFKIWSNLDKNPDLFEETSYRRKLVIERLIIEVFKLNHECIRWLLDQKKGDKPLLVWLVEDRKVYRLLPHYKAMMSGFRVCHQSTLLNRIWLKFKRCTKVDKMFNLDPSDDSVFTGTQYELNHTAYPLETTPVFAEIPQQMVRNARLFGDITMSIECSPIDNNKAITASILNLVGEASGIDASSWLSSMTKNRREQTIGLQIASHREHWRDRHPRLLLEKGTGSSYHSDNSKGLAVGDWIIFKIDVEERVVPTKFIIRNRKGSNNRGIKTISISGSSDNKHFEKWCKIMNIEQRSDKLQTFIVDPDSAYFAFIKAFRYYRIEILENYGDKKYNIFYEFGIQGVYMNDVVTDFVESVYIDENKFISSSVDVGATVFVHRDSERIQGCVCRATKEQICIKLCKHDVSEFQWFDKMKCRPDGHPEISKYIFAARAGSKDDGDNMMGLTEFTFLDINEFAIPTHLLVSLSSSPGAVHIYAKPKGKDAEYYYHYLKTIQYNFEPLHFSRYIVNQMDPFSIDKIISVEPYSASLRGGGQCQVVTPSKVIISKNGGIDASNCGLPPNAQQPNGSILKFGGYIGGGVTEVKGVGGGIICMVAGGDVINEGALICTASDEAQFSGGAIHIETDGVFENRGRIDGGEEANIEVGCVRFVNEGQLTPTPNVVISAAKSVKSYIKSLNGKLKEEQIKLEYHSHRGHYKDDHIKNVLEKGTHSLYQCLGVGPAKEDWFVFRIENRKRFIPKRIAIRNHGGGGHALKKISITGKADNDGAEFKDWIQISNIRKSSDLQSFPVDQLSGYFAWERGFSFIRINVLDNYGSTNNAFYEFSIYGLYCD